MDLIRRGLAGMAMLAVLLLSSGCTTTVVLMHLHDKLTEGDPQPCMRLNSVERALQERCGPPIVGSLAAKDVRAEGLSECVLTMAARDAQFWPVLPEMLSHGASPERCRTAPLVALAQADHACAYLGVAPAATIDAVRFLARADARSVHHDVVRLLSCPQARQAGLDGLLDEWLADGMLPARTLAFNPLSALHPGHLGSRLAQGLEAAGHDARHGLGGYEGRAPMGFDVALQSADFAALDWWLRRHPELVNRAPPSHGANLPWRPLARVLVHGYIDDAVRQRHVAEYLLARGANPWLRLPHDPQRSIVGLARAINSPLLPLLHPTGSDAATAHAMARVQDD